MSKSPRNYNTNTFQAIYLHKISDLRKNMFLTYSKYKLTMISDCRNVDHDGFCSDAGSDYGEWETDIIEDYYLNKNTYDVLKEHCDNNNNIRLDILQQLFDTNEISCDVGSGYCGYNGSFRAKSGILTEIE